MLFTLTYLFAALLPGCLITRILKISNPLLLFSLSFSLTYFVVVLLACFIFNLSVSYFFILYSGGLVLLFAGFLSSRSSALIINRPKLIGLVLMIISCCIYLSYAGFFNELPSDVYIHLEFFKQIASQLESGQFKIITGLDLIDKKAQYWYHLPTLVSYFSNTPFTNHLFIYSVINNLLILACVYEFAYWLFNDHIKSKNHLVVTALLSCLFFVLHFGVNVFSFIRYYAIAPTILNYGLYLTSIVCLINYYRGQLNFSKFVIISLLIWITAYTLHSQESLFIILIYLLISAIIYIKTLYSKLVQPIHSEPVRYKETVLLLFPLMLIASLIIAVYVQQNLALSPINSIKIIDIGPSSGIADEYLILNPFQQFYRVLSHWGLLISLLYIIFYRRLFKHQPVLLASMLVPVFTVFNHYFVDLFLRIAYADVLWRLLYMLPLYLVSARIVSGLFYESGRHMVRTAFNALVVIVIFIFLLPINTATLNLPYSRIYSLLPVHSQAQPGYWQDMLDYLQTLPDSESIITDPVTGYMISALTRHENRRHKFHYHLMSDPYQFDDYSTHPLKKYSGHIFVLNQRKGMSTRIAKTAQHWNPHSLRLTDFYSQPLIEHINQHPDNFELLWQAEQIEIYRISY